MNPRAGRDVGRYLRDLATRLEELAPTVLAGAPDAAHQMRTTARRASACLTSFGGVLDLPDAEAVVGELSWLGGQLGTFRDAEVLESRLTASHEAPARVEQALTEALEQATTNLRTALGSPRFEALSPALLAAGASATARPPRRELRRAVRRVWKRTRARHAAYLAAADDQLRDEALHELRKSLRRLRYACDALGTSCGKRVVAGAAQAGAVQEALGEHHDAVVSIGLLRALAAHERDPARIASYLLLFDVEATARERALTRFEATWPQLEPHFRRH
ncbi:CHAD domain-containing protein [Phycicoccus badiiscoriae]|uniref:CHAD domain-containing protein n=1 Tax=Pedococcus badiiscoriae TaxID=642776 RepID=A0A852WMY0_9MICO|nr:CHAD domain-containing protein [Pedococcus badiiscoriae]NYG08194.1 CHAD domain-containing protein [Pedococcus badiiscoriae]